MTAERSSSFRDALRAIPTRPAEMPELRAATAPGTPLDLLREWIERGVERGSAVPHAFTLATVSPEGVPHARTVILKDLDDALWFASSASSPKGVDLAHTPVAEAVFAWARSGRQVRVRGPVEPGTQAASDADFFARHPSARAGVIVGRQGMPLDPPEEAQRLLAEALERTERPDAARMGRWTAYRLVPERVDVVQLRPASAGERIEYVRWGEDEGPVGASRPTEWTVRDLWP
jgi:pyridoxamine 5'-phosphate oxidase